MLKCYLIQMAPWWYNFQWRFWIFEKKIICLFFNLGFRNLASPPVHKFTRWSLGKCSFSERGQCYIRGAEKKGPISIPFVNGHIIFAFAPRWDIFMILSFCTFSHNVCPVKIRSKHSSNITTVFATNFYGIDVSWG